MALVGSSAAVGAFESAVRRELVMPFSAAAQRVLAWPLCRLSAVWAVRFSSTADVLLEAGSPSPEVTPQPMEMSILPRAQQRAPLIALVARIFSEER